MQKTTKRFSIIIPVKNPGNWLTLALEGIMMQDFPLSGLEVLLINSGESIQKWVTPFEESLGIRIKDIDPTTFNHGATRNLAVTMAEGEIVVFTVQDAKFLHSRCLQIWDEVFRSHPEMVAVSGAQSVPHNPKYNPKTWYRPKAEGTLEIFTLTRPWENLSPQDRWRHLLLDNVVCAYRMENLKSQPFEVIPYGEDVSWGKSALEKGWVLGRHGAVRVWHCHEETHAYILDRLRWTYFIEKKLTDYTTVKWTPYSWVSLYLIFSSPSSWFQKLKWVVKDVYWYFVRTVYVGLKMHKKGTSEVAIGNKQSNVRN